MESELNVLKRYHKVYYNDITCARELIMNLDYKNSPNLLAMIATSYFDQGEIRLAENYAFMAYDLDYLNPRVLWILALVKWDYGQEESAIFNFKEIIRIGTRRVTKTGLDETIDIAKARINDSKLQLYRLLVNRNPPVSKRYLRMYQKGVKSGLFTIMREYDPDERSTK